jgi:hypothetical protein
MDLSRRGTENGADPIGEDVLIRESASAVATEYADVCYRRSPPRGWSSIARVTDLGRAVAQHMGGLLDVPYDGGSLRSNATTCRPRSLISQRGPPRMPLIGTNSVASLASPSAVSLASSASACPDEVLISAATWSAPQGIRGESDTRASTSSARTCAGSRAAIARTVVCASSIAASSLRVSVMLRAPGR